MVRSQIVLDDELALRTRAHAERTGDSVSSIVRKALHAYLRSEEPDVSWIGTLRPAKDVCHALSDVRASAEVGWAKEARR